MILIVDMNCKEDSLGYYEFVLPIIETIKCLGNWMVKHYLSLNSKEIGKSDAIILSGTPLKDTATLKQPEMFSWLKETDKPVLGICAGMETVGLVFGAPLKQCTEIGMTQVSTEKENPLFSGNFKVYSLHSICVEPTAEFEVWARSELCIQVMKHRSKQIYGTLFHPEVRNQEILKKFLQMPFL